MTLKFNPRNYRHLPTGGVTELHIRMSVGRGAVQRSKTKILVDPTLWDSRGQCIKARCISCPEAEKIKIKDEVTSLSNYIYNKYVVIENSGASMPEKWLEDIVTQYYAEKEIVKKVRQPKAKSDFDLLFEKFLSSRNLSIGRVRHYRIVQGMVHRFEKYVQISGGKKRKYTMDIKSFTPEDAQKMYDYIYKEDAYVKIYPDILAEEKDRRRIPGSHSNNYMNTVMKEVRAFFRWAHNEGIIPTNPFLKIAIPQEKYGTPIYLTLAEVRKIYNSDFSDEPRLAIQRDIFVFQCSIGPRVSDLIKLKKTDIVNGVLEYIPTKTIRENTTTVSVPLNNIALEIIERYKDIEGERLLPFISPDKYNDAIKKILQKAGINRLVTILEADGITTKKVPIYSIASSHMARRTLIGNVYKQVSDPNLVSSLTGHVEGSRAFARYRAIDLEMKKNLVKLIEL